MELIGHAKTLLGMHSSVRVGTSEISPGVPSLPKSKKTPRKSMPSQRRQTIRSKLAQLADGDFPNPGPALEGALAALANAKKEKAKSFEYEIANWDTDYNAPSHLGDGGAARECRKIADRYRHQLQRDASAARLSYLDKKFRVMEQLSGELCREFQDLSVDDFRVLVGGLHAGPITEAGKAKKLRKIPIARLIPTKWPGGDVVALTCPMSEELGTLSLYLGHLQSVLHGKDKGGSTNVSRLMIVSPVWPLIHDAWRLFRGLGLSATTTEGGPLDQFVGQIESWVTGREPQTRTATLKDYRASRMRYLRCARRLKKAITKVNHRATPEDIRFYAERILGDPAYRLPRGYGDGTGGVVQKYRAAHLEVTTGIMRASQP